MRINDDFSRRAVVVPDIGDWVGSPASGVERLMLDRIGDEVARATSIVRYTAGSSFESHTHALGEEFLVLEGIFSDQHGDYPAGTYVRNPPGSRHSPFSRDGCRILVKLRQFDPDDQQSLVVHTADTAVWQAPGSDGISTLSLYEYGAERVLMLRLGAGCVVPLGIDSGGAEMLIVSGSIEFDGDLLPAESWLRLPRGDTVNVVAAEDSLLWMKTGHLPA
jgi:hypothetical protein